MRIKRRYEGVTMTTNVTNVSVVNIQDLSGIEANIELTNCLLMFIIICYFVLLFFRNVGRISKRGK